MLYHNQQLKGGRTVDGGKMTVQDVAVNIMAKLQHLSIESNYETMKTLCSCLEQLHWIRQEAGKMAEEIDRLQAGDRNPGGDD